MKSINDKNHSSISAMQRDRLDADAAGIIEGIFLRQNYTSATRDAISSRIADIVAREINIITGRTVPSLPAPERDLLKAMHHRTRKMFVPMTADDLRQRLKPTQPIEPTIRALSIKGLIEVKESAGKHAAPAVYTITSAGRGSLK